MNDFYSLCLKLREPARAGSGYWRIDANAVAAITAAAEKLRAALEALEAQEELSRRGILNMSDEEVARVHHLRRSVLHDPR